MTGQANDNNDAFAYHVPVLYNESLAALQIKQDGVYVDCTFGGGGHSRGILNKLGNEGRLLAFDQDADAEQNLPKDDRLVFVPQNFRYLQRFLRLHGYQQVDGVLADLGVSSHQFNEGERGFSTRFEGPLDMRMDQRQDETAAHVVKQYSEQQLHKLFEQYGEVTNSKTLAKHIVQNRSTQPLQSIGHFKALISPVVKGNPNKYLAQVFQALRIEVNKELVALEELMVQLPAVIKPGGRAAIITFHSIEDRLVKNFFKYGTIAVEEDNSLLPDERTKQWKVVTKKPIVATPEEVKANQRSRSAKLRVAERV